MGSIGLWAVAGLVAGAVGGMGDALTAIIHGVGGLGPEKAVRLVVIATSLLAAIGFVIGALFGVAGRLRRQGLTSLLAAAAGAPLLVYDAHALFAGRKADGRRARAWPSSAYWDWRRERTSPT